MAKTKTKQKKAAKKAAKKPAKKAAAKDEPATNPPEVPPSDAGAASPPDVVVNADAPPAAPEKTREELIKENEELRAKLGEKPPAAKPPSSCLRFPIR